MATKNFITWTGLDLGLREMTPQEKEWFENLPVTWGQNDVFRLEVDSTTHNGQKKWCYGWHSPVG